MAGRAGRVERLICDELLTVDQFGEVAFRARDVYVGSVQLESSRRVVLKFGSFPILWCMAPIAVGSGRVGQGKLPAVNVLVTVAALLGNIHESQRRRSLKIRLCEVAFGARHRRVLSFQMKFTEIMVELDLLPGLFNVAELAAALGHEFVHFTTMPILVTRQTVR